jgi:hypothetical protein
MLNSFDEMLDLKVNINFKKWKNINTKKDDWYNRVRRRYSVVQLTSKIKTMEELIKKKMQTKHIVILIQPLNLTIAG